MAIANELVQLLSFKLSDQSKAAFETFKKGLEDLRSGMQAVAATATATGTAIAMTIKSVSDEAVQLTNLSKTTASPQRHCKNINTLPRVLAFLRIP